MAKLIVRKLGADVAEVDLIDGQEYFAGRASECAILLDEVKGISRQHLKISQVNGAWSVELLSRYGTMIFDGQNADIIELGDQATFSVPPYEFLYLERGPEEASALHEPSAIRENRIREERSLVAQQPTELRPAHSSSSQPPMVLSQVGESTSAGLSQLIPYLKISYPDHGKDEVVKLEGHLWVAGRDASCEIPIDDHHVSRRHFELTHTNEGFYITDLDSANGTHVNGEKIPGNEPHLLQSGDRISVMDVNIDFEVRDSQFEQRLLQVTSNLPALSPYMGGMMPAPGAYHGLMLPPQSADGPAVVKVDSGRKIAGISVNDLKSLEFYKKHKLRVVMALCVPLLIFGLLPESKKVEQKDQASDGSISFEKLTAEQKAAIKDSFQLSTNLYVKGKYELCLSELQKLHEMIPLYQNSKELQTLCNHGSILQREMIDKERLLAEQKRVEAEIKSVTDGCKAQITPTTTVSDMEECLAMAIQRDPDHFLVAEVLQIVIEQEKIKENQLEAEQARRARINKGREQFRIARNLAKKGKLAAAISQYKRFLNGSYPQLSQEESLARREVASVKEKLDVKVKSLLQQCSSLRNEGKFKEAFLTCAKAKEEDPNNSEATAQMNKAESELKTEMKRLYEDSTLEESLGNIDAALQKWKRIMTEDLKDGHYYSMAKRKLQKYGIGM